MGSSIKLYFKTKNKLESVNVKLLTSILYSAQVNKFMGGDVFK